SAGAIIGAATYLAMGFRTFAMNGAIRVAIALAIGCVLGIAAERVAEMLGKMRVVPAMSNRSGCRTARRETCGRGADMVHGRDAACCAPTFFPLKKTEPGPLHALRGGEVGRGG